MADVGTAHRLRVAVAEEVRVAMTRKRVNGAALAAAIGRSQAYVSRRLTGDTPFDVDDLERIAEVLGVPWRQFFPQDGSIAQKIRAPKQSRYGAVRTILTADRPTPPPPTSHHTAKLTIRPADTTGRASRLPA